MFTPHQCRFNVYVDDPPLVTGGNDKERRRTIALVILV